MTLRGADIVDRAALRLRASARAFTRRNLFHAARRMGGLRDPDFDHFVAGPLAERLASGGIEGLLPPPRARSVSFSAEWNAYFPAAILLVDRRELVDLFAASGVIVQARLAVVCVDGTPGGVVEWLRRGFRRGFRAPVGYLHDASTVLYPFAFEPLKTLIDVWAEDDAVPFRDLGLPPNGLAQSMLCFADDLQGPIREVEEAPPQAIVAYVARQLMAMTPRDPWTRPLRSKKTRRTVA